MGRVANIATSQSSLTRTSSSLAKAAEKAGKAKIEKRIKIIGKSVGGEIPIRKKLYSDLGTKLNSRIAAIPPKRNAVRVALKDLIEFN